MSTTTNAAASDIASRQYQHLERDPLSIYKQLSVKGRRIKARTIYGAFISEEDPMTPEEIAADRDLPLDAVLEAIAYCQSNPPEIEEDRQREERLAGAVGAGSGDSASRLLTPREMAEILGE